MSDSEERLARIERTVEANAQLARQNQELLQTIAGTEERIASAEERLKAEVKRWDERFFQLSRDTLNFTRNGVTIAAITAALMLSPC